MISNFLRRAQLFVLLFAVSAATAQTPMPWAQNGPPPPKGAPSTGVPQPAHDATHATVFLFRTSSIVGGMFKPAISDNSKEIVTLHNGRFTTITLAPGEHVLSSTMPNNELKLDVKGGETFYIRMAMTSTGQQYSTLKGKLTEVNAEQAKNEMAKLKPAETDEPKAAKDQSPSWYARQKAKITGN